MRKFTLLFVLAISGSSLFSQTLDAETETALGFKKKPKK